MSIRTKLLAGAGFVIAVFFAFQFPFEKLFKPRQEISEATTRLTDSLRADGSVDYLADLNRIISAGVTPENNALIPLGAAIRIEGYQPGELLFNEGYHRAFFKALGIDDFPPGNYLIGPIEYLRENHPVDDDEEVRRSGLHGQLMATPWDGKTHPLWQQWVQQSAEPLDAIVAATQRPRYYQPLVTGDSESDPGNIVSVLLPASQSMRHAARGLCLRAMYYLGNGDIDRAITDLKATRRLAELSTQSITLVEQLISNAIHRMAGDGEIHLINHPATTPAQLRDYGKFLQGLQTHVTFVERLDIGERYMMLDLMQSANLHGAWPQISSNPFDDSSPLFFTNFSYFVDWNIGMRLANESYDRLVSIAGENVDHKRIEGLREFEAELELWERQISEPSAVIMTWASGPRARGRWAGKMMTVMLLPAAVQVAEAHAETNVHHDLIKIAIALELWRRERGEYPQTIDQLSPSQLDPIPPDRFTGNPLRYETTKDGYLLYSVGRDKQDDGGIDREESLQLNAGRNRGERLGHDVRIKVGG